MSDTTLLDECEKVRLSIGLKADRNKRRARWATLALAGSTVLIPVTIVVSGRYFDFWLGKVAPSILAAITALVTAWVQIERPHERWSLFRRYQRLLEGDELLYKTHAPPFNGEDRDTDFAATLARRQMDLHDEWAGLLPRSSDVSGLVGTRNA